MIKQSLTDKIAKYKIPARIIIVDEIPVTPNGKVDKQTIKTLFQS
jgi:fatty-acyl-CoA synthase/long-chain acyl-CoA synthetase